MSGAKNTSGLENTRGPEKEITGRPPGSSSPVPTMKREVMV
ncbi:hypothetical protein [Streptomyces sp. OE57]